MVKNNSKMSFSQKILTKVKKVTYSGYHALFIIFFLAKKPFLNNSKLMLKSAKIWCHI